MKWTKFLRDDTNISSMRVKTFSLTIAICIVLLACAFNIAYRTILLKSVAYESIAVLLSSCAPLAGVLLHYKHKQKQTEVKNNNVKL